MEELTHFYCKIGDVETTTPWDRPNIPNLRRWYKEWKDTPGLEKYEIYLVGNFAEINFGNSPHDTWDVDVVLHSKTIYDNAELKNIIDEAVRIGFKHRILIDIFHNDRMLSFDRNKPFIPFKQTRGFKHFHKERNDEVFDFYVEGDRVKELEDGLYEISHPHPAKSIRKCMDRYDRKEYKGIQVSLREIFNED